MGKEGLKEYADRGYLPRELGGEIVSRTLDYGFADFSTSLSFLYLAHHLAEKLPEESDVNQLKEDLTQKAKSLYRRAVTAFRSSFDSRHGLMVPKSRNGGFSDRFSPIEWGNGYTEGNAWHHSFPAYAVICPFLEVNNVHVRQAREKSSEFSDLLRCENGLMALYGGGAEGLLKKLYQLVHVQSRFQVGSYGQEIHEMTESVTLALGQYAHNNQPVHHILYLFAVLGDARTTQRLTTEVMERGYGEDFYAGDEDNGEMGSWFVLSALGLYSIAPGSVDYVISKPLFRHVRITHPKKSSESEEEVSGEYLDLFAYDSVPPHTSSVSTSFVNKVTVESNGGGNNAVTIGSDQHYLISDHLLQGNNIIRFHYEDTESDASFESRYSSLTRQLHQTSTSDLDRHHYHYIFTPTTSSTSSSNAKTGTTSESSEELLQKLQAKEREIAVLKKQLSSSTGASVINDVTDSPASSASIGVFYLILGVGFLLALAMAKLLEYAGCVETSSAIEGGGGGGGCNSTYFYVIGCIRRIFLKVRSVYSRGVVAGSGSADIEYASSWSLKSQAHTV